MLQTKLLDTMEPSEDMEEVEILRARFQTFDQELDANEDKVHTVNEIAQQLLQSTHPNADEVIARQNKLNEQ